MYSNVRMSLISLRAQFNYFFWSTTYVKPKLISKINFYLNINRAALDPPLGLVLKTT